MNSLIDTMPLCVSYRNVQERGEPEMRIKTKLPKTEIIYLQFSAAFYKERQ